MLVSKQLKETKEEQTQRLISSQSRIPQDFNSFLLNGDNKTQLINIVFERKYTYYFYKQPVYKQPALGS